MTDSLPHVVSKCSICGKYVYQAFYKGSGWVAQAIDAEKATALVLMGVPFRQGFYDGCAGRSKGQEVTAHA